MKAMVLAMAARVGESAVARWWHKAGAVLDCAIPIALTAMLAAGTGMVLFGLPH